MNLMNSYYNRILDSSIYFSFDQSGYQRHARAFDEIPSLSHQHIVITGASRGIGYACAQQCVALGANVTVLNRSSDQAKYAYEQLQEQKIHADQQVHWIKLDLNHIDSIQTRVQDIQSPVHGLIHNAGLLPNQLSIAPNGFELTRSVHLLGMMQLTWALMPALKAGSQSWLPSSSVLPSPLARIILVSSGGMYTQKLAKNYLNHKELGHTYDGVVSYAQSKRAQVEIAHILHSFMPTGIDVQTMHPGWVNTDGVQNSLPKFDQWHGVRQD